MKKVLKNKQLQANYHKEGVKVHDMGDNLTYKKPDLDKLVALYDHTHFGIYFPNPNNKTSRLKSVCLERRRNRTRCKPKND
jgi:hypothetical protein